MSRRLGQCLAHWGARAAYLPPPLPPAPGPSQGPEELWWDRSDLWQPGLRLFIPIHAKPPAHREVERSSDQETTGESCASLAATVHQLPAESSTAPLPSGCCLPRMGCWRFSVVFVYGFWPCEPTGTQEAPSPLLVHGKRPSSLCGGSHLSLLLSPQCQLRDNWHGRSPLTPPVPRELKSAFRPSPSSIPASALPCPLLVPRAAVAALS